TPRWAYNPLDNLPVPDPLKPKGVGVLSPYRGVEPPEADCPPYDSAYCPSRFLPSQIDQVKAAVGNRPIDILMISAGGNDLRFPDIAKACLLHDHCSEN